MKNLFLFFILSVLSVGKNFALATSFRKAVAYQKKDVRFTVFTDGVMGGGVEVFRAIYRRSFIMAVERNLPVPEYKIRNKGKWIYWAFSPKFRYQLGCA